MAEPGSKDDDLEQYSLWQLLNTPIGDINRQTAARADQNASRSVSKPSETLGQTSEDQILLDLDDDDDLSEAEEQLGRFASKNKTAKSERRKRGFAKRHSANSNPNPNRKQHNFRDTTKKVGFHTDFESSPIGQSDTRNKTDGKSLFKPGFFSLALGVFLPIAAMLFENTTHYMAQTSFDPFPTPNHLLLFSLIPISNFLNWLAVRRNLAPFYSIISLSTGMALGIAILYSVMLLPLTPEFAVQSLVGVGLLGLAPLLSIPITMLCGNTVCQLADRQKTFFDAHQLKHLGHTIILVMVLAVELPSTLTRMHLTSAVDGDQKAIQWLRQWGSQDVLLRACYERSGEATDILGTIAERQHPISVDAARDIYYRVTGVAFNSVPLPASFRGTIKHAGLIEDPAGLNDGVKDEFDLDPDIAGELVSGVARGLSVSNSDITGSLDSSSGVASLDWNFTFENVSTIPREARAKILLPPNAVVTKATLWLDDLQRETVIQERDLARNTYVQSVTSHKRDPLLVSMAGKDAVLVQCYPVVKGTKTKIRLHIVAPLIVANKSEESLVMPTFEERNFAITIPHKIDLTSKSKISLTGTDSQTNGSSVQLKKELDNSVMSRFEAVARVAMANDESSQPLAIRPPQTITEMHKEFFSLLPQTAISPSAMALNNHSGVHNSLTVIVDKSVSMSPYVADIVKGLKTAPKSLPITIIEVKDGAKIFCKAAHSDLPVYEQSLKSLAESKCEGGQSDGDALMNVFRESNYVGTTPANRSDVLWIHAAQPMANFNVQELRTALLSHSTNAAALYDLQVASGPNAILPESYDYPKLNRIVRTGSLADDISTFIENYSKNQIRRPATVFGVKSTDTTTGASTDLAQVQAYKLAMSRYQAGDKWGAYDLAARYHLVTPVSSAVVTEEVPIAAEKEREMLAEKKAIDQLGADQPILASEPASAVTETTAGNQFKHFELNKSKVATKKEMNRFGAGKLDKTQFYNAPRQLQIVDERPVVTDFREEAEKSALISINSRESSTQKQLRSYPKAVGEQSYFQRLKPQESAKDKEYDRKANVTSSGSGFGGGYAGSYSDDFSRSNAKGLVPPSNNEFYGNPYSSQTAASPPALKPSRIAGRMMAPKAPPGPVNAPAPAVVLSSPTPSPQGLMGATNGTVGPQEGDASIGTVATRDSLFGGEKQESRARRRLDSGSTYDSDSLRSAEPGVNTAGTVGGTFSPFSGVVNKLNSLSSAAGSAPGYSSGSEGYGQDWNPYTGEPAQQVRLARHGFVDSTLAALLGVGIAFIVVLTVFFRLLAKMKTDGAPKGPIQ